MTLHGFRLYAFVFLINGVNIWASSFFTALNNGVVSGMIAFLRTLLFQIGCIMLLPLVLGLNGIWMGVVVAEMLTLIVTIYFYGVEGKFITTRFCNSVPYKSTFEIPSAKPLSVPQSHLPMYVPLILTKFLISY